MSQIFLAARIKALVRKRLVPEIDVSTVTTSSIGAVPTSLKINSRPLTSNLDLSAADVGAVPTTRQVNSKNLSTDISLNYADVGAIGTSEKGTPNGVATLDVTGKLVKTQIPSLTPADVGLGNVDNTSDLQKPISVNTQIALNQREQLVNKNVANGYAGLDTAGKLSKSILPVITKTDVGLGNVDNTSDANKPISGPIQTALDSKVNNSVTINGLALTSNINLNKTHVGLSNVDNTSDLNKSISTATQTALNLKENIANKNVANGYAGLDGNSQISQSCIPIDINFINSCNTLIFAGAFTLVGETTDEFQVDFPEPRASTTFVSPNSTVTVSSGQMVISTDVPKFIIGHVTLITGGVHIPSFGQYTTKLYINNILTDTIVNSTGTRASQTQNSHFFQFLPTPTLIWPDMATIHIEPFQLRATISFAKASTENTVAVTAIVKIL